MRSRPATLLRRAWERGRDIAPRPATGRELAAVRRSLARQSVAVAVVAAAVDGVTFALSGICTAAPAPAALVLSVVIAADLAFAAPPATAAVVAVVQVALRLGVAALLHRHGLPVRAADVGFLVAGYRAGAWLSGRASSYTVPVLVLGACGAPLIAGGSTAADWRLLLTASVSGGIVPWLVGRYTAGRGAYIAELEQRERLAHQQQRAALERALADEREAIARDLHDVISHHVSAIGIHAGAARLALHGIDEAAATRSLAAVESESRAAMVDLRRQLDLLHGRDDAARQPGMADIDDLVERARGAGLELTVTTSGVELPRSLDITVYRIVQELLTNALRHGAGSARLAVRDERSGVVIEQSNPVATQHVSASGGRSTPSRHPSGADRVRLPDAGACDAEPAPCGGGPRAAVRPPAERLLAPSGPAPGPVRRSAAVRQTPAAVSRSGIGGASATGLHRGLDGIRRRAELFGGSVEYGSTSDNQWRVLVRLPGGRS
ncbi:histidine kinase [Nocardia veterana]|uniref:histidine kinase n=1 Tax=Nocardia veterana TaxID=132249 RepID=UPI001FDFFE18|nr:histidine kinase [Nocardia veterana]